MSSTGRNFNVNACTLASLHTTSEVTALGGVAITSAAGVGYATMLRAVCDVQAGDVLDVEARCRVTNQTSYTVGVGYHLWCYDADDGITPVSAKPWQLIGRLNGDNVTARPRRHHMPCHLHDVWEVPADWPAGHRPVVVMRVDAHSTAAQPGDELVVDDYGVLTVRVWRP